MVPIYQRAVARLELMVQIHPHLAEVEDREEVEEFMAAMVEEDILTMAAAAAEAVLAAGL